MNDTRLLAHIHELSKNWGWYLLFGVGLIVLGSLAIMYSLWATLVSIVFFGATLFIAGFLEVIQAVIQKKWSDTLWHVLLGILYAVIGLLLIVRPVANAQALTLLMASFFLVAGIFKVVLSLALRLSNWFWSLLSGVLTAVLGILIFYQWPVSGLWVIGLFVGIDLIMSGWSWLVFALTLKQIKEKNI